MSPKRASTGGAAYKSKRVKITESPIVTAGLASVSTLREANEAADEDLDESIEISTEDSTALLAYIAHLEEAAKPREMSSEDIRKQTDILRKVSHKGIKSLMKWKPSCKNGSARFLFDGVCSQPIVMANLLDVEDATKFKTKKFTRDQFAEIIEDEITAPVRYNTLCLTSDINLRWNCETGEYKWTGSYGIYGSGKIDNAPETSTKDGESED